MFVDKTTGEEITFAQLKERFPLTLFPEGFAEPFEDFAPVQPIDPPEHDPATHKVIALPPVEVDGAWLQQWSVVPLTQQEIDDARRAAVPQSCTPAQGLVALYAVKGITEDDLNAAIEQIADQTLRYTVRIAFARATEWRRSSPAMQQMAEMLSLTEADLEALFAYAVTVEV